MPLDATGLEQAQEPVIVPNPGMKTIDDILAEHAAQAAPVVPAVVTPPAPEEPAQTVSTPPQVPALPPELARLMTSLQEKEATLDARLREAEEAKRKYEPLAKWQEVEQLMQEQDALAAVEKMGVRLEDLNKAAMEGRGVNPSRALETRLAAQMTEMQTRYEARLAQLESERTQNQQAAAMAEIQREVTARSPLLSSLGQKATELVWTALSGHYDRTGQVVSYEQVIGQVENQYRTLLKQALAHEAVRKDLEIGTPAGDAQKAIPEPPKTLTNSMASQVTHRAPKSKLPVDRDEAIAAILSDLS